MSKVMYFFITIGVALSYFYFNWHYFTFANELKKMQRFSGKAVFVCFTINFILFYGCSAMEIHLIYNWTLFAIFLYIETVFLNNRERVYAWYGTMVGILCGLSVNICSRGIIAIIMGQPLTHFDNHVSSGGNLKSIPILLGFIASGMIMKLMSRKNVVAQQKMILSHPQHNRFLLQIMTGLFLYLFLNLLLYQSHSNRVILKLWGVKSCVFSVAGFYVAFQYTHRICELAEYKEKNRAMERELYQKEREEQELRNMAFCDTLTGFFTRQKAVETIEGLFLKKASFTVCFIDLDGLKAVNDQYGHTEGDRYILAVAQEIQGDCRKDADMLFRYGGDEFVILVCGLCQAAVEKRMHVVNCRLQEQACRDNLPYAMSISYGVVESRSFSNGDALLVEADARMYNQKQKKRLNCSDKPETELKWNENEKENKTE